MHSMGPFGRNGSGDPRYAAGGQRRAGGMRWWVLLVFGAYLGYYYLSHRQDAAFTGRKQMIDATMDQEVALGLQSFQQILGESHVVDDPRVVQPIEDIARRLISVGPRVEQMLAEAKGISAATEWDKFEWQVAVIESEQANAFCLPGGKMAVYTGILPVAKNADALAAVMGHEIAHALLRHGSERMAQQKLMQIGTVAAGMSTSEMDPRQQQMVMAALGAGARFGIMLPFSRDHESEADYVGLMLTAAACYDPEESIGLWERMSAGGGQRPPEFMSTHPSGSTRISQLQSWMGEAKALQAKFCQ
jgi:metalloendopeptidase OMA1, mitochondrial